MRAGTAELVAGALSRLSQIDFTHFIIRHNNCQAFIRLHILSVFEVAGDVSAVTSQPGDLGCGAVCHQDVTRSSPACSRKSGLGKLERQQPSLLRREPGSRCDRRSNARGQIVSLAARLTALACYGKFQT